jgi:hypothetical protein
MVLLIIFSHKILELGIFEIANKIIYAYNDYFAVQNMEEYILDYGSVKLLSTPLQVTTFLICVVSVVYIYILIIATYYKIFAAIHIILSMAFVMVGMLLGKLPSTMCMAFLIFYYLVCAIFNKNKKIYIKRVGILAISVAVITGMVMLLVNPKKYDGEARYTKYGKVVDKFTDVLGINKISDGIDSVFAGANSSIGSGGIGGGKLGEVDGIEYSGEKIFNISMIKDSNNVYLKGFVGNWYTGNSWEAMGINDTNYYREYVNSTQKGSELIISNDYDYIQILKTISSKKTIAITYLADEKTYKIYPYYSDIYIPNYFNGIIPDAPKKNTMGYDYYSISTDEAISFLKFSSDEDYDSQYFFESISTDVPDNIEELFDKILTGDMDKSNYTDYDFENPEMIMQCVKNVQKYLADNTQYTLKPGRLEKNKDYVEDFLTNKKKGYCTAYASAATLMFRYYGIPARYVEGYVITQKDQKDPLETSYDEIFIELKDSSAHAWTEIYISGIGFIPVEVTPGYYGINQGNSTNINSGLNNNNENDSTEVTTEKSQESKNIIDDTEITTDDIRTTDNFGRMVTNETDDKKNDENIFIIYGIIFAIIVIIMVFAIVSKNNSSKRYRKLMNYNTNNTRHNIKILDIHLRKIMKKYNISYSKDRSLEQVAEELNNFIDKIQPSEEAEFPDKEDTLVVLRIIEKQKYSDENAKFTDEECKKVRQYVENLKNSLQYYKNRL